MSDRGSLRRVAVPDKGSLWRAAKPDRGSRWRATKSNKGSRRRDWSSLLLDLLSLISGRLSEIEDYIAFRSVCKTWRSAATPDGLPPQLPWLLLQYNPESTIRRFLSISTGKIYTFNLPETRRRVIYTSPHGSLLMTNRLLSITLLNPITRSQTHLPPPPTTLDRLDDHIRLCRLHRVETRRLPKIPNFFKFYRFNIADECVVGLVVVGPPEFVYSTVPTERTPPQFMYWRAQDRSWIKTHPVSGYPIITVAYHCSRLYIIHENGDLAACDVGSEGKLVLIPSLKVPIKFRFCYLVSLGAELLLITAVLDHSTRMQQFCCFKLEQGRWSRIQGMGDYTVFTRNTERTIIAPAGDGSCIFRNSIYTGLFKSSGPSHQDLEVLSLEKSISEMEIDYYDSTLLRSSWFVPSLC